MYITYAYTIIMTHAKRFIVFVHPYNSFSIEYKYMYISLFKLNFYFSFENRCFCAIKNKHWYRVPPSHFVYVGRSRTLRGETLRVVVYTDEKSSKKFRAFNGIAAAKPNFGFDVYVLFTTFGPRRFCNRRFLFSRFISRGVRRAGAHVSPSRDFFNLWSSVVYPSVHWNLFFPRPFPPSTFSVFSFSRFPLLFVPCSPTDVSCLCPRVVCSWTPRFCVPVIIVRVNESY